MVGQKKPKQTNFTGTIIKVCPNFHLEPPKKLVGSPEVPSK